MSKFKQGTRLLNLGTPLGPDVLLLAGFSGTETMSRLFSYQLEMFSNEQAIPPKDIVGKNVSWCVQHFDQEPRYFNGYVYRFAAGGRGIQDLRVYRAEVVPWLWFLTRTANCRIFQNKSVKDIIKIVFDDHGFSDYDLSGLKRSYPKLEYCVQYRETTFNFVSRLMEQFGIFYFFLHENGKHILHLADHKGAYKECREKQVRISAGKLAVNHVTQWDHQYDFRPGKWAHTDYNFETPNTNLLTSTKTTVDLPGNTKFEVFDYPGEYPIKGEGEKDVTVRMEEEEAAVEVVSGAGLCSTFTPGGTFQVEGHDVDAEAGKSYVVTSVRHSATDTSYTSSSRRSEYSNTFTCIPDSVTFRPPRTTPKPVVMGTQPAVVVGPSGQEIYTDKYGRVKVQFFWDREGKRDEKSSCWIRVSQVWAGRRWGASFWPRIGQEVIVAFHEGDPDRPIILGSVYNADQMPPYLGDGPDPKHKNDNKLSGFKSNSTLGGKGFNELRFDDNANKEQVFIHAERNMDVRAKGSQMSSVGGSSHLTVGGEKDGNKTGEIRQKVFKDMHVTVGNDEIRFVEHDRHDTVKNNVISEVLEGGSFSAVPKGNTVQQGKAIFVTSDTSLVLKGKTIFINADTSIQLSVGGNFVTIDASGVTVFGSMVRINCPGSVALPPPPAPPVPPAGGKPTAGANTLKPEEPVPADNAVSGSKSSPD